MSDETEELKRRIAKLETESTAFHTIALTFAREMVKLTGHSQQLEFNGYQVRYDVRALGDGPSYGGATPWQRANFYAYVDGALDSKQPRGDEHADPVIQRLVFALECGSLDELHRVVLQMGSDSRWWHE